MYNAHRHNACLCSAHCYASCHSFAQVNTEIVAIQRVITPAGETQLKELIQAHADKTGSAKAAALLADWSAASQRFWQVGTVWRCSLLQQQQQLLLAVNDASTLCYPLLVLLSAVASTFIRVAPPKFVHASVLRWHYDAAHAWDTFTSHHHCASALLCSCFAAVYCRLTLTLQLVPPAEKNSPQANPAVEAEAAAPVSAPVQVAATA
jgi:glutamate synthase domain-containing protein 3